MEHYFRDKVVVVTGSSKGIGKAVALRLCQMGAKVMLNGRTPGPLEETCAAFLASGYSVEAFAADVTDYVQCELLIKTAVERYGKLDILITSAGISMRSAFEKMQPEVFRSVLDSNIYGTVFPAKAALPYLKTTGGHLVMISSVAGFYGLPASSAYSMGKMSLTALAQNLRIELAGSGVHTGIVYVGFTENETSKRVLDSNGTPVPVAYRPRWLQQSREEVANAVLRLIYRRKPRIVLTVIGKMNAIVMRFFPGMLFWVFRVFSKNLKKMIE